MKNLRTFEIVDYVKSKKYCSMNELMEHFHVSIATIHRDVSSLVEKKLISKVHGGVAALEEDASGVKQTGLSSSYLERINRNRSAKQRIADAAFSEISDGDIIFLDSSTTVYYLSRKLMNSDFGSLTVVTNSALIISDFHNYPSHYVLMSVGGTFDAQLNSFIGQAALRELEHISITKAFVSAFGIHDGSAWTNHEFHSLFLSKAIEKSMRRFLLADSSKFERSGLFRLADMGMFEKVLS